MKKLLAVALALALCLSLTAPALAAEANGAVELMSELGLLETVPTGLDDGAVHTDTFVIDGGGPSSRGRGVPPGAHRR